MKNYSKYPPDTILDYKILEDLGYKEKRQNPDGSYTHKKGWMEVTIDYVLSKRTFTYKDMKAVMTTTTVWDLLKAETYCNTFRVIEDQGEEIKQGIRAMKWESFINLIRDDLR